VSVLCTCHSHRLNPKNPLFSCCKLDCGTTIYIIISSPLPLFLYLYLRVMLSSQSKERARRWAKNLECPVDENAEYQNTFWCNRDLIPIPYDRRTWTWQGFAGYWIITGINTTAWTSGSSLLALGLSVGQAMGVIVGVALITGMLAVAAGWMGSHKYIGFTVLSRSSWGMRGGFWPVLNRIMTASIWLGIQAYWGGQSVKIVLGALIGPRFVGMRNTLPLGAHVDTSSLVSFFVFLAIFAPTLMVSPERLQIPFRVTFIMITSTMIGMLIWALCAAHGAGPLIHTGSSQSRSRLSWNIVYGLQAILGSYGSGCLGQSDWTRYACSPNAALFGQAVAAPLTICLTALCGLLITSATATLYGEILWNPLVLLLAIQERPMSAAARAGTFFAGLGFLTSQLALCIVLNCVSGGMDIAALYPRYINIRRGSCLLAILAVATCPWNFVTQATTFITVLSGWSVFLSPMTGILISDYFLVRYQDIRIQHLYIGDSDSEYWYWRGFNWRAFAAWVMGIWPLLPGFVRQIRGRSNGSGWDHLYDLSYFFGFLMALLVHWGLSVVVPDGTQRGIAVREKGSTEDAF